MGALSFSIFYLLLTIWLRFVICDSLGEEYNDPAHKVSKYTSRQAGPRELVRSEKYRSRLEAMKREHWLKSGAGRQWLNNKLCRAEPPWINRSAGGGHPPPANRRGLKLCNF